MGKLRRVVGQKWIGGVSAGRLTGSEPPPGSSGIWVVLGFCYGIGIVPYILLWIFMPRWVATPDDYLEHAGG